jgi:hypothetical protein
LFSELKIHDKEEVAWKRLKAEGLDKDGLKEAELQKNLTDQLWDLLIILFSGLWGSFPRDKAART